MLVKRFDPVVGQNAGVVILGTLPGGESLKLGQYYADTGNAFWFIVGTLFGIDRGRSYDERKQGLIRNRIAIWDVLERAERNGSQDNKIVKGSEVPNDFAAFFCTHPSIKTVFFNGRTAEKYFRDLVVSGLQGTHRFRPALMSTSGNNTHATREEKAENWRVVQRALASPGCG